MIALLFACTCGEPGTTTTFGPGSPEPVKSALTWRNPGADHEGWVLISTAERTCADARRHFPFPRSIEERAALLRVIRPPGASRWQVADAVVRPPRGGFPLVAEVVEAEIERFDPAGPTSLRVAFRAGDPDTPIRFDGAVQARGCGDEGYDLDVPFPEARPQAANVRVDGVELSFRGAWLLTTPSGVRLGLSTGPGSCTYRPRSDLLLHIDPAGSGGRASGGWVAPPREYVPIGPAEVTLGSSSGGVIPVEVRWQGEVGGRRVEVDGRVEALDCRLNEGASTGERDE